MLLKRCLTADLTFFGATFRRYENQKGGNQIKGTVVRTARIKGSQLAALLHG